MPTLADVLRQTGYSQDGTLGTPTPTESPMTKALADHLASIPQKFNQNQAYQMALLNKAFPGNTYESMMTQGDPKAMAELAMQTPFNAMIAYHGTPHNILGKFDISKVGTGEGAQAYGHGMYFAESPEVAKTYMPKFEEKQIENAIFAANGDVNKAIQKAQLESISIAGNKNVPLSTKQEVFNLVDGLKKIKAGKPLNQGNLYKVDIPDEYIPNMLDWDKPISQQSDIVKKALNLPEDKFAGFRVPATGTNYSFSPNMTGAEFYKELTDLAKTQAGASEMLNSMGIKGVRYFDEGSRGWRMLTPEESTSGKYVVGKWPGGGKEQKYFDNLQEAQNYLNKNQTSNFVVFDPSEVKILEKNSKPVSRKQLIEEQVNKLKD